MTSWYKITVQRLSQFTEVYRACDRLGMRPTDEIGLLSFVVQCAPKSITLLQLQYSDVTVSQYSSMINVLRDYYQNSPDRNRAQFSDLFE